MQEKVSDYPTEYPDPIVETDTATPFTRDQMRSVARNLLCSIMKKRWEENKEVDKWFQKMSNKKPKRIYKRTPPLVKDAMKGIIAKLIKDNPAISNKEIAEKLEINKENLSRGEMKQWIVKCRKEAERQSHFEKRPKSEYKDSH